MSNIHGKTKHVADGHQFEIATIWSETEWQIVIFDDQQRQVGPVYSVSMEDAEGFKHYRKESAIEALIAIAKGDLDSGRVKSSASGQAA